RPARARDRTGPQRRLRRQLPARRTSYHTSSASIDARPRRTSSVQSAPSPIGGGNASPPPLPPSPPASLTPLTPKRGGGAPAAGFPPIAAPYGGRALRSPPVSSLSGDAAAAPAVHIPAPSSAPRRRSAR